MGSPGVYFYKHINYVGLYNSSPFTEGFYTLTDLKNMGVINDDLSSLKIVNNIVDNSTYTVTLYQHDNYNGNSYTTSVDIPNLVNVGGNFNDITSSVKIVKNTSSTIPTDPTPTPTPTPSNTAELYNNNRDSSVTLTLIGTTGLYTASGFFFNHNGTNSGIYIGTCAHCVLENGSNRNNGPYFTIYASISNFNNTGINRLFKTRIVGIAGYADAAVLELVDSTGNILSQSDISNQKALKWAAKGSYNIGDECYVIGDPGGLDAISMAHGHIRDTKNPNALYIDQLWTDCAIMGGNSGSPVVDNNGDIVGIISYGYSNTELNFGSSQAILEPVFTYICNNRTNYVGGTISNNTTTMTVLNPVNSLYLILKNKTYQSTYLGTPLRGFYASSGYTGLNTNTDIITYMPPQGSSGSVKLGLYHDQEPPTQIYLATGGNPNASTSIGATIHNIVSNTDNDQLLPIRGIPVDDDVYIGHSSAPMNMNVKVIRPIKINT